MSRFSPFQLGVAVAAMTKQSQGKYTPGHKLYYFEGRNTGIVAGSREEAIKKKKRGGDNIVAVRDLSDSEKAQADKGKWIRTRKDGKSPAKSEHGKGRGYGPPRKTDQTKSASGKLVDVSDFKFHNGKCKKKDRKARSQELLKAFNIMGTRET